MQFVHPVRQLPWSKCSLVLTNTDTQQRTCSKKHKNKEHTEKNIKEHKRLHSEFSLFSLEQNELFSVVIENKETQVKEHIPKNIKHKTHKETRQVQSYMIDDWRTEVFERIGKLWKVERIIVEKKLECAGVGLNYSIDMSINPCIYIYINICCILYVNV